MDTLLRDHVAPLACAPGCRERSVFCRRLVRRKQTAAKYVICVHDRKAIQSKFEFGKGSWLLPSSAGPSTAATTETGRWDSSRVLMGCGCRETTRCQPRPASQKRRVFRQATRASDARERSDQGVQKQRETDSSCPGRLHQHLTSLVLPRPVPPSRQALRRHERKDRDRPRTFPGRPPRCRGRHQERPVSLHSPSPLARPARRRAAHRAPFPPPLSSSPLSSPRERGRRPSRLSVRVVWVARTSSPAPGICPSTLRHKTSLESERGQKPGKAWYALAKWLPHCDPNPGWLPRPRDVAR